MSSTEGDESPRLGTLAWLQAQDAIEHLGAMLPSCHRVPEGASLAPADATDTRCRVTLATGERCKGTRLHAYGLCMGHAGGGGTSDGEAMRAKAAKKQAELKLTRQILGVGPVRSANPRAAARLRAAQRASELASALVDGPLDADLDALAKQRAALTVLDATFPLQTSTISMAVSDDPDSMDWKSMQELAASLLG